MISFVATTPPGARGYPLVDKNRGHLDISAPDIRAVKSRIEALGGQQMSGYEDGGFLVMADPEGNEFCVVSTGPIDFGEEGRTHYLETYDPDTAPCAIASGELIHDALPQLVVRPWSHGPPG